MAKKAKAKPAATTDAAVAKVLGETWSLKVGDADKRQMSTIHKSDDPEFLIGYVLTEDTNKLARAEDIARGAIIAAAPRVLSAALAVVKYWKDMTPVHPNSQVAKDLMSAVLDAIGTIPE